MRIDDYIKREGQASIETRLLSDNELTKLQSVEIEIAADIIGLCEKSGIDYMLGGGSCLGAMRHDGFIPWDDDIDINMTLDAWNNLEPLIEREFGDKYLVWSPRTGADINAIKIYYRDTSFKELGNPSGGGGIFVDVFVIQNAPDNLLLRTIQGFLSLTARYISSCTRLYGQRNYYETIFAGNSQALRGYRKRFAIGKVFSFRKPEQWVRLYAKVDSLCRNSESRYVTIPTGMQMYFGELILREKIFPTVKHRFEQHEWNVPHDADAYLSKIFGNWRQVPPKEKRERHVIVEIDFGAAGNTDEHER